jgi:hypothetical protein
MFSKPLRCVLSALFVVGVSVAVAIAQAPNGGSSIQGRVTLDGKPAPGITVALLRPQDGSMENNYRHGHGFGEVKSRTTTDRDGNYSFNNVPPGDGMVFVFGPTLSAPSPSAGWSMRAKLVFVGDGETVTGMDFALVRAGVITGRVTTADGQPAISASVHIARVDQQDHSISLDSAAGWPWSLVPTTDDRGIYRKFDLDPGQYVVRAQPRWGASPAVYYPGVTDKARAKVITVSSGQEIQNIDIALGNASPSYEATGQALDDSGKPVAGVMYYDRMMGSGSQTTDENGRFRFVALQDGQHSASLQFAAGQNYYCDPADFTVTGANVTDLRIKVHTGASMSGAVMLEGDQDPEVLSQLPSVHLDLRYFGPGNVGSAPLTLDSEGNFQATGLAPGTATFSIEAIYSPPGFSVVRIERNGVSQPDGIVIGPGDQIAGVTIVLAYGAGILRGQVTFQGGSLPPGTWVSVQAQPVSEEQTGTPSQSGIADARGRFEIENLADGQYKLSVDWFGDYGNGDQAGPLVIVSGGQAPEVNLVVDLSKKR